VRSSNIKAQAARRPRTDIVQTAAGVFLYRFEQNSSGQVRIELAGGKPGDRISFRCGEHKNARDRLFGGYVAGIRRHQSGTGHRGVGRRRR